MAEEYQIPRNVSPVLLPVYQTPCELWYRMNHRGNHFWSRNSLPFQPFAPNPNFCSNLTSHQCILRCWFGDRHQLTVSGTCLVGWDFLIECCNRPWSQGELCSWRSFPSLPQRICPRHSEWPSQHIPRWPPVLCRLQTTVMLDVVARCFY